MHDGLYDAANTAALYRFLEKNPEFTIEDGLESYLSDEPCTFTLGNVFANLGLAV